MKGYLMEHSGGRLSCSWGYQKRCFLLFCHWTLPSLGLHQPSWLEGSPQKRKAYTLWMMHEVVEMCIKVWVAFIWAEAGYFIPGQAKLKQQENMEIMLRKLVPIYGFVHILHIWKLLSLYESCYKQNFLELKLRQVWLQMTEILNSHGTCFLL